MQGRLSLFISTIRSSFKGAQFISVAGGLSLLAASAFFLISCGGSNSASVAPPPVPVIQNVNSTTDPVSPVGLPIEINGSGFQGSPGQVVFTQASSGITATVTPNAGGWSSTGIAVTVPAGSGTNNFTVPGTVTVAVKTTGGTSNAITLSLIQTLTFDVNNVQWTNAATIPTPLTGLRAAGIPVSDTTAYVVTTGGFDGTSNTSDVFVGSLNVTGDISAWTTSTNIIPETIAHHGMVEANSTNSLVSSGSVYIYVIGGQMDSTAAPGGTTDVYSAPFDTTTGTVGAWVKLTSSLPESLVGPAVTLFNGYVYVIGGLKSDGTPSADVFSAPVNQDGTLGTWTKAAGAYPTPVSFATAFGFAGRLYVLNGDTANSTDPNAQGTATGTQAVNFASAINGVVGTWTVTSTTIKNRKKAIIWPAFGQIIDAEGIYSGLPGSLELERSQINPDSTLASFNGITASVNQIMANVYNAAAVVSPLQSPTATPSFLLIGGQSYVASGTSTISDMVYYNNAP